MTINKNNNPLQQQCLSLPQLCRPQIDGAQRGLAAAISKADLAGIRNVILTGCGDSFVAAKACIPAFEKFAGRFGANFRYESAIDAARHIPLPESAAASTLVVGISCSGGPARITEALRRANQHGYRTMAVTNNPSSSAAKEATYAFIVNTPSFPDPNPGLRNYFASLTALYFLAANLGVAAGLSPPNAIDDLTTALTSYVDSFVPVIETIDKNMLALAQVWQHFNAYEYIGDDIQFCTAFFCAAKMVEVVGKITSTDDAENWCHVNYFFKNPNKIGTVVVADVLANDKTRIGETLRQAGGIGRPLLLVSNGTAEDFAAPACANVCTLPHAPSGYEFLSCCMDFIPGSLLASHISALQKEPYFRQGAKNWEREGAGTIRTSKIEII